MLDKDFGNAGKSLFPAGFPSASKSSIHAITIDANQRVVAAGQATVGPHRQFALARFNEDGTADELFGNHGWILTELA